jgi:hypothetical protein
MGDKKHHSMIQGIGQKIKYASQIAGAVKTGFNVAKGAYSVFQAVSPYLAAGALLLP